MIYQRNLKLSVLFALKYDLLCFFKKKKIQSYFFEYGTVEMEHKCPIWMEMFSKIEVKNLQ